MARRGAKKREIIPGATSSQPNATAILIFTPGTLLRWARIPLAPALLVFTILSETAGNGRARSSRRFRDSHRCPFIRGIRQTSSTASTMSQKAVHPAPPPACCAARSATGFNRIIRTFTQRSVASRTKHPGSDPPRERQRMATPASTQQHVSEFAADVRESLTKPSQRELPSKYLYDEVGSALFEAICVLPEYGLTRADSRLLRRHSKEIVSMLPGPFHVAELGSGSGKKTRWILEALSRRGQTFYYPIEISPSALEACEKELGHIEMVSMVGYERPYLEGLRAVAERRERGDHLLVLFLGSTIGNFDRSAGDYFLLDVRNILKDGDALLLGTDLVKDVGRQLLAYDDP